MENDPFLPDDLDKNIFLTPEINRRLKQAKQHILESQKVLLIASPLGAGKSLLSENFVILKEADWRVCLVRAEINIDIESFAESLVQQLLPGQNENGPQALSLLHKYLEQSHKEEARPVIVIDDAEKLSKETLQFLLQLADLRYNESLYKIILFANESISETLDKAGVKELATGIIDTMIMPSFTADQVRSYLKHKFSFCGDNIEFPFNDVEMEYLFKASGGLAGGVNILVRKMMQEALIENKTNHKPIGVMSLVSVILLALVAYLYYENLILKETQNFFQDQAHEALVEKDSLAYQLTVGKEQVLATT
jgi:general secretion pathway protein A